jgi:hypothetical protein
VPSPDKSWRRAEAISVEETILMGESRQAPEFGGECAFALSTGKKGVTGKSTPYTVQDGKKYLLSNPVAKLLWRVLPSRPRRAQATWARQ